MANTFFARLIFAMAESWAEHSGAYLVEPPFARTGPGLLNHQFDWAVSQLKTNPLPIVLLPGMMADHRLLAPQRAAFPQLRIPDWPPYEPDDTLGTFAERLANELGQIGPCFVGGVSFGGIVALELARHLDARGCILISSVRSFSELPLRYRICRPVGLLHPAAFDSSIRIGGTFVRPFLPRVAARRLERMTLSPFFCWATRAVLRWKSKQHYVPIAQIHGTGDSTFPIGRTKPDKIVENAGHMLVTTHATTVNEFISQFIASYER